MTRAYNYVRQKKKTKIAVNLFLSIKGDQLIQDTKWLNDYFACHENKNKNCNQIAKKSATDEENRARSQSVKNNDSVLDKLE